MADGFLETEEQETRRRKKYFDRLQFVADADFGYQDQCACGGRMVVKEMTDEPTLGRKYLTCNAFKDDGLHFRKPWDIAIEEEVGRLMRQVDGRSERHEIPLSNMRGFLENNAKDIVQLKELVGRLRVEGNKDFEARVRGSARHELLITQMRTELESNAKEIAELKEAVAMLVDRIDNLVGPMP